MVTVQHETTELLIFLLQCAAVLNPNKLVHWISYWKFSPAVHTMPMGRRKKSGHNNIQQEFRELLHIEAKMSGVLPLNFFIFWQNQLLNLHLTDVVLHELMQQLYYVHIINYIISKSSLFAKTSLW